MIFKPTHCLTHCSYAKIGRGFAGDEFLGTWPPKLACLAEAAGWWEVIRNDGVGGRGRPLIGPTGRRWEASCVVDFGYQRSDVLICNTLRCNPPGNQYPIGSMKLGAEASCQEHDALLRRYKPDWVILTYHPAFTFKQPQVWKYIKAAFRMAWRKSEEGKRPLVMMGLKGAQAPRFSDLRFGPIDSIKKWQRHYWEL